MGGDQMQPVTQRTGGGVSARVAAVGAVALLLGVAWLGMSGRPDAPAPTPPAAALTTPTPPIAADPSPVAASPSPGSPVPSTKPVERLVALPVEPPAGLTPLVIPQRYGPLGQDAFAVTAWVKGRFYMSLLREESPGHMGAVMRLPLHPEMPATTLQVIQLWTRDDRPPLAEVAAYDLPLDDLLGEAVPEVLLSADKKAKPRRAKAPRLVREGYELTVTTDVRSDHAFLLFEITVGDAEPPERESDRLLRITRDWRDFGLRSPATPPTDGLVHPELVEWGITR